MKSRLIARDIAGARGDADWALDAGAAESESPIGRYSASLASLVIGDDDAAAALAATLASADAIPSAVTMSLIALANRDAVAYADAIHALTADFEARDAYLEDIPVADTVLALQVLAEARGISEELASPLLPGG